MKDLKDMSEQDIKDYFIGEFKKYQALELDIFIRSNIPLMIEQLERIREQFEPPKYYT